MAITSPFTNPWDSPFDNPWDSDPSVFGQLGQYSAHGIRQAELEHKQRLEQQTALQKALQAVKEYRLPHLTTKDLDHPMFNAPLSVIENLWAARFGDAWVKLAELTSAENNDFVIITRRLERTGRLEVHTLGGTDEMVYRLKT